MHRHLHQQIVVLLAALAAAYPCLGQAVPPENPADETIVLSPFEVNASSDTGYIATSSLSGGRMNTALKDTAASISVMTSEFLADIAAINFTEALQYANNVQFDVGETVGSGDENEPILSPAKFRVRGVQGTITRNYFPWTLSTDNYNVDRIEEMRGPNSILFGIGAPSGIINATTKKPTFGRNFNRVGLQFSAYDSIRGTIDSNQGNLHDRFALRLNAVHQNGGSYLQHAYDKTTRVDLGVAFKVTKSTLLQAQYESGRIRASGARPSPVADGVLRWVAAGQPIVTTPVTAAADLTTLGLRNYGTAARVTYVNNLGAVVNYAKQNTTTGFDDRVALFSDNLSDRSVNAGGPGQFRVGSYNAISVFLDQKFGEHTFAQLAYNHQDDNNTSYMAGIGRSENNLLKADPMQFLPDGSPNPHVGEFFIEGDRWSYVQKINRRDNTRLQLSHELDLGKWGNYRLAGMGEYQWSHYYSINPAESWAGAPFNVNPEAAANVVWRRSYVNVGDWGTYYISSPSVDGLIKDMPNPIKTPGQPATLSSTWILRNAPSNTNDAQKTLMIGGQARYFKNRLVFGLGLRNDWLERTEQLGDRDPVTKEFITFYDPAHTRIRDHSARTKTLGVVWHAMRNASLFFNHSDSFDLPGLQRVLPNSEPPGKSHAIGEDFGILFTMLNDRINFRVNHFTTDLKNGNGFGFSSANDSPTQLNSLVYRILVDSGTVTQAQADAAKLDTNGAQLDRRLEGYEAGLTANVTKNWRISANYSFTEGYDSDIAPEVKAWATVAIPHYKSFTQAQDIPGPDGRTIPQLIEDWEERARINWSLEGITMKGARRHKASVVTRYNLPWEPLKGAFVGGAYAHQSKSELQLGPDNTIWYGNSFWTSDAFCGYHIARLPWLKNGLGIQLNMLNVFNHRQPNVISFNADHTISKLAYPGPRRWRLSFSAEF